MSNEEHFERVDLRQQVTATLRARREALVGTLSSVLAAEVPLGVDAGAWATLAGQLLDAISAFTESGQTDSNTEVLDALERHTHLLLGTKQLFACVHLAERTCLEDLGRDERQGTARFESSAVDQLVKRASSDLVSSLTQRLAVTPAHAAIRDPHRWHRLRGGRRHRPAWARRSHRCSRPRHPPAGALPAGALPAAGRRQ